MANDVQNEFMAPLMRQFTLPRTADGREAAWASDYVSALGNYPSTVLREAARRIVQTAESRTFPMISECLSACREAQNSMQPRDTYNQFGKKNQDEEWSERRIAEANRLICSEMGRLAAREGWIFGLHDFCRKNSRLPDQHEASEVRAASLETVRFMDAQPTPDASGGFVMAWRIERRRLAGIAYGAAATGQRRGSGEEIKQTGGNHAADQRA